jgi:hypothetical protein
MPHGGGSVSKKKANQASLKKWRDVVRSHARTNTKTAEIGGRGDDVAFEQAFSNLAHAYLQDSAPKLLDHEIGFQLLDRNRENTKAVGVFAFKLGSMWLYAPVFFLNGDLKGHELLYIKNQDMFVPLKENWVNYLVNRKPGVLGSGIDKNLTQFGQRQPDFTQLSRSPAKFGSAQPTLKEMMTAVMPTLAKTATMNTGDAFKELGRALNLPAFLKQAGLETLQALVKSCQYAPAMARALDDFHGLSVVQEAIATANARGAGSQIKRASILAAAPKTPAAEKTLKIITHDVAVQTALPPGHTEEDQEKLLRDGVLILDNRDRDNVSVPYQIQVEQRLFNPTASGLYHVLVKPGEIEKCYIAVHPMGPTKRSNFVTVVRVDGTPEWINTPADRVFCFSQEEGDEFDSWFDGLPEASSLSKNGRYILLNKKGDTTVPLRVIREYGSTEFGGDAYEVHMEDHSKFPAPGNIENCCYTDPLNYSKYRDGVRVHINGKGGQSIKASMGDIFIPEGYRMLKCAPGEDDAANAEEAGQGSCGCAESKNPPLMPGNLADAQLVLMQKMSSLTVYHTGTDVRVNDVELSPRDALIHLVKDHGLREKAAQEILGQARTKRKFSCHIKYANPYGSPMMIEGAPTAPSDPGPVMGGETIMGTSIPTQLGIDVGVPVADMAASQTDRSVYNPNTQFDDKAIGQIMEAANTGQREVFDTAMIGTMLRAVRDDSLVDRYMGDLTKGLDKLGRILFMFYWHGDRFADRYGKADMPELEDSLRNAFEMLGDVILFLKQKTIEPFPDEAAQDIDLGSVASAS